MVQQDDDIHLRPAALVALMVALFGGNMALTGWQTRQETVRPDPFTGTEGRALERKIDGKLDDLQHQIDNATLRINSLSAKLDICLARMNERG